MQSGILAVDVRRAVARIGSDPSAQAPRFIRPVRPSDVPVSEQRIVPSETAPDQAVLSWRWDLRGPDGASRNLAAAIAFASEAEIAYLFVDKFSIDQSLSGLPLMQAVADFSRLFGRIATVAAYDTAASGDDDGRHFLRNLRRPWIAKELLAMRGGECPIHYLGHIPGQGFEVEFGFRHMVERIWETRFANSLLYVLTGQCDMHDASELPLVLPEHASLLSVACRRMSRSDALLTAALLTQRSADSRVNGDIDIRAVDFHAYRLEAVEPSPGYWRNWQILLDGAIVGHWSEKDYTRDGLPRRKLSADDEIIRILSRFLEVDSTASVGGAVLAAPKVAIQDRLAGITVHDLSGRFVD